MADWTGSAAQRRRTPKGATVPSAPPVTEFFVPAGTHCHVKDANRGWKPFVTSRDLSFQKPYKRLHHALIFAQGVWLISVRNEHAQERTKLPNFKCPASFPKNRSESAAGSPDGVSHAEGSAAPASEESTGSEAISVTPRTAPATQNASVVAKGDQPTEDGGSYRDRWRTDILTVPDAERLDPALESASGYDPEPTWFKERRRDSQRPEAQPCTGNPRQGPAQHSGNP